MARAYLRNSTKHAGNSASGFTLIELMIVISIIAILVALAMPAYQNYIIRAKVTECVAAGAPIKISLSEFYQTSGRWPANITEAGIYADQNSNVSEFCSFFLYNPNQGDYAINVDVSEIDSSLGIIYLIMSPEDPVVGGIDWNCQSWVNATTTKYLPSTCRDIYTP